MSRTPIDTGHAAHTKQVQRYRQLEREQAENWPHPNTVALNRRRKGRMDASRIKQYLRIARGRLV